jgi:hypothetical protein
VDAEAGIRAAVAAVAADVGATGAAVDAVAIVVVRAGLDAERHPRIPLTHDPAPKTAAMI